jgi:hypothetical protein
MRRVGPFAKRVVALIVAVWASLASTASAEPLRRIVLIVPRLVDPARQQAALGAVRAQLGDLAVQVVVEQPAQMPDALRERLDLAAQAAKSHGALGAFVLELDRSDDLLIFLVEPEARRALMRRVESPASEAAGFEELSLIVRSTSSALLEGREIGMEAVAELAPAPGPAPELEAAPPPQLPPRERPQPEPSPTRSSGRLAAFYVGEAYAPEAGWLSGLGLRVSVSPDGHWFLGLGYALLPPLEVDTGTAAARVTRYPGEAFAGYEFQIERARLGAELGARIEIVTRATVRTDPGMEPTPDDSRLLWGMAGRALLGWLLSDRVSVGAALGAETFFNDSDFVVDVAGERRPALRPRSVRPRAEAGVAVNLW